MPTRWSVEIARLGHPSTSSPTDRHCVEAESWRNALASVRRFLGQSEQLNGISIEVLADGVRAVDPMSRTRFTVTKAPPSQPLTIAPMAAKPSAPTSISAPPPATSPKVDLSQTLGYGSKSSPPPAASSPAGVVRPPRTDRPPATAHATAKKAPEPSQPPTRHGDQIIPPEARRPDAPVASVQPQVPRKPSEHPPATVPAETNRTPENFKIILKRFEEPTDKSPIAYREVAYALEPGTGEEEATSFLMAKFEEIRATLTTKAPGKLVNLAAFDHTFDKRPKRPPIVTLVWKDWKSIEPEIRFPQRPGQSIPPASLGTRASSKKQAPAPTRAPSSQSAPPTVQEPVPMPSAIRDQPTPLATPAAIRAVGKDIRPVDKTMESAGPVQVVPAEAKGGRTAPSSDIVADIFEAMHDLYFLESPAEGAEFVLSLSLEKFHALVGIVQLYDINERQFVVMSSRGPYNVQLAGARTNEADPLLREIMKRHAPFVIDAVHDPRTKIGRWQSLGVLPHWILASGVQVGGRFLGTVEVALTEADDEPFGKIEIDAMTYIVERFAEFVVERGLVFSAEEEPHLGR